MNDLLFSLEAIDYQGKSALAFDIETSITELQKLKKVGQLDINSTNINKLIKKHTGLTVKINVIPGLTAHVYPPFVSKNNPIFHNMKKEFFLNLEADKEIQKKDKYVGTVDLKNSKVKGDFSEAMSEIFIGEEFLNSRSQFTPGEVTAVILHEIGHVFVMFEMLGRFSRTNYYMESAMRRILDSETKEQRIRVLDQLENLYGTSIPDKDRIAKMQHKKEYYRTLFLSIAVNESYNQLGFNLYDLRGYEQLADQFASRHGMGLDLASALNKIMSSTGQREYWWVGLHYYVWILEAFTFLVSTVMTFGLFTLVLMSVNYSEYDTSNRRLEKLKHDAIHALKDSNLPKEVRNQLLETVKIIDSMLNEMNDNESFYSFLWNSVIPFGRKEKKEIVFNEELERMLNNSLFASAQLLKHNVRNS